MNRNFMFWLLVLVVVAGFAYWLGRHDERAIELEFRVDSLEGRVSQLERVNVQRVEKWAWLRQAHEAVQRWLPWIP